jgi:crotonobetainyl-CoA:carnitine CoA-transferase CaiB-like acyl-CoA transferase
VRDDDEFSALAGVLGLDATDPTFRDVDARFAARHDLDRRVGDATPSHTAAELAAKLRAAGVPAEVMASAPDLAASPLLRSRELFVPVEHPVWGSRRLIGLPWRVHGQGRSPIGTPPMLVPAGSGTASTPEEQT